MFIKKKNLIAVIGCLASGLLSPFVFGAPTSDELTGYLKVKRQLDQAKPDERAKLEQALVKTAQEQDKKKKELYQEFQVPEKLSLIKQLSRPYLRRSYADLLSVEAVELGSMVTGETKMLKDTKGALFNYSNNQVTHEETWNAEAALLMPFVFATGQTPRSGEWSLPFFGVMPSVTLHRFTTSLMPTDAVVAAKIKSQEADELTYRLGLFAPISTPWNFELIGRLNGAWQTDTHHGSSEPALEGELEPIWQSPDLPWFGLGYFAVPPALEKPGFDPNDPKTWRKTYLAYQARFRGRYLLGGVEDDGTGKKGPNFERAGFTAELNLDPVLWERLSASVKWTYMPVLYGPVNQDQYLETGFSILIWENPALQQKATLDFTYKWGATDYLGAKKQDIYNVGIGILY